ncbi:FG-GAP repeat domain-containing protein [Streptomyces flavofungini]|uniref:VCBS repeat-containing protein n=1 Tax=Streptomyces flavofungini TaxID=68200 RepID=A0ABS0WXS1_9ACTN|nr:VCBS repeat-containing protein [Streptomyces flavofungini]MBJ3805720.1 VCBS repeat-containing protein [Streptomyces flavofungini]GHC72175.1 histidine kinase [Streptomyces flavofungini]
MRSSGRRLLAAVVGGTLLLAGCSGDGDKSPTRPAAADLANKSAPQQPVPRGKGSKVPDDFNGDGARDLVLDALAHRGQGDDPGIGIVYGSRGGLVPGARQLLTAHAQGARTKGQLPAAFESEASCDLDEDGFTDLVVSTDPPYDGQGRPPVPLQILFGSPTGLTGKAVKLQVPARARLGNDWADQPVCGDFDGDGANDLVLHASGAHLTYLRGPFTRKGAPRAAGKPITAPGNDLATGAPAVDVNDDGYDDLVVRAEGRASKGSLVLGGPKGPNRTGVLFPASTDVAFGAFGRSKDLDAALAAPDGIALRYDVPGTARAKIGVRNATVHAGDLDGDGRSELVVGGGGPGEVWVYRGRAGGLAANATATVVPARVGKGTVQILQVADFDGDRRADLVVRTAWGQGRDRVEVYPGRTGTEGPVSRKPGVGFSTVGFR